MFRPICQSGQFSNFQNWPDWQIGRNIIMHYDSVFGPGLPPYWIVLDCCYIFSLKYYSTVGCRRTGGTALQPGPFLFFPNLADFVLISIVLISSAHACTCMHNHVHVHVLHQNSFLTHFSSLSTFLNFGEIPAWPFFGKPFFGTRQYCSTLSPFRLYPLQEIILVAVLIILFSDDSLLGN